MDIELCDTFKIRAPLNIFHCIAHMFIKLAH